MRHGVGECGAGCTFAAGAVVALVVLQYFLRRGSAGDGGGDDAVDDAVDGDEDGDEDGAGDGDEDGGEAYGE